MVERGGLETPVTRESFSGRTSAGIGHLFVLKRASNCAEKVVRIQFDTIFRR